MGEKFRIGERCEEASCKDAPVNVTGKVVPPGRDEIGRAAWRYLHTMAAHYPENPTPDEVLDAQEWLVSFINSYPCGMCSEDFVQVCARMPPKMESRKEYSLWWCHAHNAVHKDLSHQQLKPHLLCVWNAVAGLSYSSPTPRVER